MPEAPDLQKARELYSQLVDALKEVGEARQRLEQAIQRSIFSEEEAVSPINVILQRVASSVEAVREPLEKLREDLAPRVVRLDDVARAISSAATSIHETSLQLVESSQKLLEAVTSLAEVASSLADRIREDLRSVVKTSVASKRPHTDEELATRISDRTAAVRLLLDLMTRLKENADKIDPSPIVGGVAALQGLIDDFSRAASEISNTVHTAIDGFRKCAEVIASIEESLSPDTLARMGDAVTSISDRVSDLRDALATAFRVRNQFMSSLGTHPSYAPDWEGAVRDYFAALASVQRMLPGLTRELVGAVVSEIDGVKTRLASWEEDLTGKCGRCLDLIESLRTAYARLTETAERFSISDNVRQQLDKLSSDAERLVKHLVRLPELVQKSLQLKLQPEATDKATLRRIKKEASRIDAEIRELQKAVSREVKRLVRAFGERGSLLIDALKRMPGTGELEETVKQLVSAVEAIAQGARTSLDLLDRVREQIPAYASSIRGFSESVRKMVAERMASPLKQIQSALETLLSTSQSLLAEADASLPIYHLILYLDSRIQEASGGVGSRVDEIEDVLVRLIERLQEIERRIRHLEARLSGLA